MAYNIPSFSASSNNAAGFGRATALIQSGIDFNDVKSDIATKTLAKLPLEQQVIEANLAKAALSQYGANLRNREVIEANEKTNEQTLKQSKRTAALNLIKGLTGDSVFGVQEAEKKTDPRDEMIRQLIYERDLKTLLGDTYGIGVNPSEAVNKQIQVLGSTGLDKTSSLPQQTSVTSTAPKLELPTPTQTPSYSDWVNAIKSKKK